MILLSTLNARYSHSSLGLRYLYANMEELQAVTRIEEFTIDSRPIDVVEKMLGQQPKIIGLSVYIWNARESLEIVSLLKRISPETVIVIGGPEVSHEWQDQEIVGLADYLITGTADLAFHQLCCQILKGKTPLNKVIEAGFVHPCDVKLPYQYYNDEDIANRVIYVEASRGCPFKCEFCLSALDKTAWPFDLDIFLQEMEKLYQRGVRHFKFVDRTFNLKIMTSIQILDFFLEKNDPELFLHFELVPDHLNDALKEKLKEFSPNSLQFEIGIQTFNPEIQTLISRKQNNTKAEENLLWLREHTESHIHADLIVGLPGEDAESFAQGFDRLYRLGPHEIQVGILKRLRGSPIIRHTETLGLVFNPMPPYNILKTKAISFEKMQDLNRFARYWDMIANSGRFSHSLPVLLGDSPFARFSRLSQALFEATAQTHKIALRRLFELVYQLGISELELEKEMFGRALSRDFLLSGIKGKPSFHLETESQASPVKPLPRIANRQARHQRT
ncbi:MAG: DUF4080 domain-containing protein [Gammaproteobacteria bacterium]|nr:DUF4080 domain-containing protein [Gammaproteobacteria bacterium]